MDVTEDGTSIHRSVAGFICWLARQGTPTEVRRIYPSEVDRYLRWRRERLHAGADGEAETYLAGLRGDVASPEQEVITDAISHYRLFLNHEADLARDLPPDSAAPGDHRADDTAPAAT